MPITKLAFNYQGQPQSFWCEAEKDSFPGEYAEIIEGYSYPFFQDIKPSVILDIGANVGVYSLVASLVWPEASIIAYEPEPQNFKLLQQNVGHLPNVACHNTAVGPVAGRRKFYLSGISGMCHSLFIRPLDNQGEIEVEVVAAKDLPPADLVKIDIEGPELQVLEAMNLDQVKWLYVEFHREEDRLHLDHLLLDRFYLRHARIMRHDVGEVMYQRRGMQ